MIFKKYIKESVVNTKKLILDESIEDMNRRCENCNTLLNDSGTCPKCDHGEEDYGDKDLTEEMSVREKLKAAYPELNFDVDTDNNESGVVTEELTNKEKLLRAYPELNFDTPMETDEVIEEELSNKEKLKTAYPELNFDDKNDNEISTVQESLNNQFTLEYVGKSGDTLARDYFDTYEDAEKFALELIDNYTHDNESGVCALIITDKDDNELFNVEVECDNDMFADYDDDYEMDDVEQDRAHAALYGGDRMYCDCGERLVMTEWGGYCPKCSPDEVDA